MKKKILILVVAVLLVAASAQVGWEALWRET